MQSRILIVSCVFPPEPVVSSQISNSLAIALSNDQHLVKVIAPFPSRPKGFTFNINLVKGKINHTKVNSNLDLFRLPSFIFPGSNPLGRLWEGISFGSKSYRFIRSHANEIDKVYMNTWPIFGQLGVALACKKEKIPYSIHIQDIYPESLSNKLPPVLKYIVHAFLFPIEKYVLKNATDIFVISENMQKYIIATRNVTANNIYIINNWQDHKSFEAYHQQTKHDDILTFMYLGNIGPVAGIPFLIRSFVNSGVKARLIIAGSGSKKKECMQLAESYNADIKFVDVPVGEVAKTQSMADVFLLPVIKGGAQSSIPSKLPAYMFSAKPVIASVDTNSDSYNVIHRSGGGWTTEPENEQQLIELFRKIVQSNKEELQLMGRNAYQYALKEFSQENNLNKLKRIITTIWN